MFCSSYDCRAVSAILNMCHPFQIIRPVICFSFIKMIYERFIFRIFTKAHCNKSVNTNPFSLFVFPEFHS